MRQRCRICGRYEGFDGFDTDGRCVECASVSPQEQTGAELLAMRRRAPKAPLSKLHDKMLGRST